MKRWPRRLRQTVRFWWQRRTRGWDDSELWNLDHSLAKLIAPRLRRFTKATGGHPCDSTEEQWQADLEAMTAAFEWVASDGVWDIQTAEEHVRVQRGLDLFAKNFRSLWN